MKTKISTKAKFRWLSMNILSIFVVVAIAFPAATIVQAAANSPFAGQWKAIDLDGSDIRLAIAGRTQGPFQITWTESYISFCSRQAGLIRGSGWLNESNPNLLEADLHLECFTTGSTLDFQLVWRYHTITNTLSSRYSNGVVIIWQRPGGPESLPPTLNLRVNYADNWVESFYEGGHAAWITVTESDGVTVKATAELITEPKDFWGGETGFQTRLEDWSPSQPDIQPKDWVYGWVDNGASAQVQIGEINGMIDLEADSIQGTISAPWITDPVQVECLDWGSGGEQPFGNREGGFILTNGADPYSCSWAGEWNIQPGQTAGVGYFDSDGNWVANGFFVTNPTFVAYVPGAIEGYDWPMGNIISINIKESEYTARGISEQRPDFPAGATRVLFELWRDNISIKAGDHIVMADEMTGMTKDVVVTNLAVTDIDVNAGTVSGVYDPAYDLWVWLYGREGQVPATDPNNGTWVATFSELPLGAWGGATQWEMDGDGTSLDFQVPDPLADLIDAAQQEGALTVIALPNDWCNFGNLIQGFTETYGIPVNSVAPFASSADELQAIRDGIDHPGPDTPDVIDVGPGFALQAQSEGLITPYRVSTWDSIPDFMKDGEAYWYADYYGVMSIAANTDYSAKPSSWEDLRSGENVGGVALGGDPTISNMGFFAVYSAALANGGSLDNIEPGLQFFQELNTTGHLLPSIGNGETLVSGGTPVLLEWSYLALAQREEHPDAKIEIVTPPPGPIASFYAQAVSAYALHPNAARLWMEYLYSDGGQIAFLQGHCFPARFDDLMATNKIPANLLAGLPDITGAVFPSVDQIEIAKAFVNENWRCVVYGECSE